MLEGGPVLICHLGMSGSFRIEDGGDVDDARHIPSRALEARGARPCRLHRSHAARRADRASSSTIRAASASCCFREKAVLDQHPMLAGLGVEPTGNALERRTDRRAVPRPDDAAESGAARPAADRRHRQHLCLRGAVARQACRRGAPRASIAGQAGQAVQRGPSVSPRRCARSSPTRSRPAARRCATISTPTARSAISSIRFTVYDREGEPCPRPTAAAQSRASCRPAARPSIARSASDELEPCATRTRKDAPMAYETIIVETRGKVGLITLNRPKALNALNSQVLSELDRGARARSTPIAGIGAIVHHRLGKGLRRRRRHQGNAGQELCRGLSSAISSSAGTNVGARAQADHRRGRRLCAGRRLRTRHDVRLHHRRRHRQIRPAGDHARRHARHGRLAAADPLRRQVEGHGHVPDRADDGCGRSRALAAWCRASCRRRRCSTRR